jgi:hypothetical protein
MGEKNDEKSSRRRKLTVDGTEKKNKMKRKISRRGRSKIKRDRSV